MTQDARPGVTVVIPTRDRPDLLRTCLAAVAAAVGPDDEVIVVDSASTRAADVAEVVRAAGVRLVRLDVKGASRARNAGWRAATRDVVVFTDDDCLPQPGWTQAFAAAFTADIDLAWGAVTVAVGGTGAAEHSADLPASGRAGDDLGLLGASNNLAVRRSALDAVGGFDERLGPGTPLPAAEDKDLLDRLLRAGGAGVLVPDALVEHVVWRSRWQSLRVAYSYGIGQSALRHKLVRQAVPVSAVFPDGLLRTPVRQGWQAVRDRYETGVALSTWRFAGMLRGRWLVRGLSVVDGHLAD
jgi:glycosyltransferase involved in cell wall biosynthesis